MVDPEPMPPSRSRSSGAGAVARARRVVGLYGDPDVTWSIVVAVDLAEARDLTALTDALDTLVDRHPHLGARPEPVVYADEGPVLARFADTPYGDHDPLLRVALAQDGQTLLVAAHHGAMDGLGLLGAASVLAGVDLATSAKGITWEAQPGGFLRRSVVRVAEALLHPPQRLAAESGAATGDLLLARTVTAPRPGSAALVAAVVATVRRWTGGGRGRLVVSMGLSRRPGSPVAPPDRDTAYVRLAADDVRTTEDAAALLAATPPEPAFPESDAGGLAPRAARLLANRLGATVLVSNLGRIADARVTRVRFWPVPTGPAGCAVGLATTAAETTVTLRVRGAWFAPEQAEELAGVLAEELERVAQ